jgi:hypothetical protein
MGGLPLLARAGRGRRAMAPTGRRYRCAPSSTLPGRLPSSGSEAEGDCNLRRLLRQPWPGSREVDQGPFMGLERLTDEELEEIGGKNKGRAKAVLEARKAAKMRNIS